jgi:hypothetical protein
LPSFGVEEVCFLSGDGLLTFTSLLLQAAFCDDACVERYLKVRGNNCRRAARLLKATLNWREKINIGNLIISMNITAQGVNMLHWSY